MATTLAVRTDLVLRDQAGRLVGVELVDPGPDRIDTCDCHRWAWPVTALTWHDAAESWDCPLMS